MMDDRPLLSGAERHDEARCVKAVLDAIRPLLEEARLEGQRTTVEFVTQQVARERERCYDALVAVLANYERAVDHYGRDEHIVEVMQRCRDAIYPWRRDG